MHRTTLYLDDDLHERIKRLAESSRKTQAAIIREAVRAFAGGKTRRPRSVGLGRSGRKDLSLRVDEFLDGMGKDA